MFIRNFLSKKKITEEKTETIRWCVCIVNFTPSWLVLTHDLISQKFVPHWLKIEHSRTQVAAKGLQVLSCGKFKILNWFSEKDPLNVWIFGSSCKLPASCVSRHIWLHLHTYKKMSTIFRKTTPFFEYCVWKRKKNEKWFIY